MCTVKPGGAITGDRTSDPHTLPASRSTYTATGQTATVTETSGGTTRTSTTSYDTADRPETVTVAGGTGPTRKTRTVYGPGTGQPVKTQSLNPTTQAVLAEVSWHLDSLGRTDTYTDATGNTTSTSYDIDDPPVTSGDPSAAGASVISYSSAGDVYSVSDPVAGTVTNTYDAGGQLIQAGLGNGVVLSQMIDPSGAVVSRRYTRNGVLLLDDTVLENIHGQVVTHTGVSNQSYGYDAAGRLTTVADRFTTAAGSYDSADRSVAAGYSYDPFARTLTTPADPRGGLTGAGTPAASYTDTVDDRIASITAGGTGQSYSHDPANRTDVTTVTSGGTATGSTREHYADNSDSPAWTDTRDAAGAPTATTRYINTADGSLITTTGGTVTCGLVSPALSSRSGLTARSSPEKCS